MIRQSSDGRRRFDPSELEVLTVSRVYRLSPDAWREMRKADRIDLLAYERKRAREREQTMTELLKQIKKQTESLTPEAFLMAMLWREL